MNKEELIKFSQDESGKWIWESPYYEVFSSVGFPTQEQAADSAREFLSQYETIKPTRFINDSKADRLELAREFRQAAETLRIGLVEENIGHER